MFRYYYSLWFGACDVSKLLFLFFGGGGGMSSSRPRVEALSPRVRRQAPRPARVLVSSIFERRDNTAKAMKPASSNLTTFEPVVGSHFPYPSSSFSLAMRV